MERNCYQCGGAIEERVAFCPQCAAPQIRVSDPLAGEASDPASSSSSLSSEDAARSAAPNVPVRDAHGSSDGGSGAGQAAQLDSSGPAPLEGNASSRVDWSQAVPVAALSGFVIALSWALPVVGFFLWMAATGTVAVILYCRRLPAARLTAGAGARIGVLAGLFGYGVFMFLFALQMLVNRGGGRFRSMLQQIVQQAAAQNTDPRAQEILARFTSPQGLAILLTFTLILSFFAFLLFSGLGGALGASLLKRRQR